MFAIHVPTKKPSVRAADRSGFSAAEVVRAVGIEKTIDDRPIIRDLSFDIPRGRFVALMGANGAGKTTLLNMLATLTSPTRGELSLFGEQVRTDSPAHRARIGVISHRPMIYRELSAMENLTFFAKLYGVRYPRDRARELLEYVSLDTRRNDPVATFSRGMTQRVSIARALVHEPELLLADEPFTGLDAPSVRSIESILSSLHTSGKTIVLANHDIEQSLGLANWVLAIRSGRLVLDVDASECSDPDALLEAIRS
jgi:ABC-type multidrug transport system ATPase subunit